MNVLNKVLLLLAFFSFSFCTNKNKDLWPGYFLLFLVDSHQECNLDMLNKVSHPPDIMSDNYNYTHHNTTNSEYILIQTDRLKSQTEIVKSVQNRLSLQKDKFPQKIKNSKNIYRMRIPEGEDLDSIRSKLKPVHGIQKIQKDHIIYSSLVPDDTDYTLQWGLKNSGQIVNATPGTAGIDINSEAAWDIHNNCSSSPVAIVDSGINFNHEDLSATRWINSGEIAGNGIDDDSNGYIDDVSGWDFSDNDNNPSDLLGHGTHVAGILAAGGNNAKGTSGICWNAKLVSLRVLNEEGIGYTSDMISAINYANALGIKIMNMSLTIYEGQDNDLLYNALQNTGTGGAIIVAAAGNDGSNNDTSGVFPASYSLANIISVGAADQSGNPADFSNFGSVSVDIFAPGVNIQSTYPLKKKNSYVDNFYSGLDSWIQTGSPLSWKTELYSNPVTNEKNCILSDPSLDTRNYSDYWDTMIYKTYDLSGAEVGYITYILKVDTEPLHDKFYVKYSSTGNIPDQTIQTLSGNIYNTTGWFKIDKVFKTDKLSSNFNLGFHLTTNESVTQNGVSISSLGVYSFNLVNNRYVTLNGTSMAAPFVTGIAALLYSYSKDNTLNCTNTRIKNAILINGKSISALSSASLSGKIPDARASLDDLINNGCP